MGLDQGLDLADVQRSHDHHEAGHAVVDYVMHAKQFARKAELWTICCRFDDGRIADGEEGPRVAEAWGDLGGSCAEWIARKKWGLTKLRLDEWLDQLSRETLAALESQGCSQPATRDDLCKAIWALCPNCMNSEYGELTGRKRHFPDEVLPQAEHVCKLLEQWWDAVEVLADKRAQGRELNELSLKEPCLGMILQPYNDGRDVGAFEVEWKKQDVWKRCLAAHPAYWSADDQT